MINAAPSSSILLQIIRRSKRDSLAAALCHWPECPAYPLIIASGLAVDDIRSPHRASRRQEQFPRASFLQHTVTVHRQVNADHFGSKTTPPKRPAGSCGFAIPPLLTRSTTHCFAGYGKHHPALGRGSSSMLADLFQAGITLLAQFTAFRTTLPSTIAALMQTPVACLP